MTDKSKRTKVFDWKVPMQVGAQNASVTGTLFWQPKPGGGIPTGALIGLVALAVLGLGAVSSSAAVAASSTTRARRAQPHAGTEAW